MATFKMAQIIYDKIYPVGSVYFSKTNTDPKNLFGGTWTRITGGHYVYAANSSYEVTSQTGSSTNAWSGTTGNWSGTSGNWNGTSGSTKLTVSQIPAHNHSIPGFDGGNAWAKGYLWNRAADATGGNTAATRISTNNAGGSSGHTHSIPNHNHSIPSHNHSIGSHSHTLSYVSVFMFIRTA